MLAGWYCHTVKAGRIYLNSTDEWRAFSRQKVEGVYYKKRQRGRDMIYQYLALAIGGELLEM